MFPSTISRDENDKLPLTYFKGQIFLIDTLDSLFECLPLLNKIQVFGFDTETKPAFKKGIVNQIALLQLCTSDMAFLIRLNKIGLPGALQKILTDTDVIKTGIAIRDDLKGLKKYREFKPSGFIELQDFVKKFGIESNGLKKLAAIVMKIKISKSQQISNWDDNKLSVGQLRYAATDGWVCYEIYSRLKDMEDEFMK